MQLRQLLEVLPKAQVSGPIDLPIAKLECDSRLVGAGDLFVAIRGGQEQDRHRFVPDALARGARAVVVEQALDCRQATRIVVENCRQALARLAACYYRYPGNELKLVGITGTNGKTTTALLMQHVLEAAGESCGYLGTLGAVVAGDFEPLTNTTPEAPQLHRWLRAMVDAGKRAAVLEVSSHGLALERVAGLKFKGAIFTNLTRDHLDFHRCEENYFNAKARLFDELDPALGGRAAINLDDPAGKVLLGRLAVPVVTYGMAPEADVRLLAMIPGALGMRLHFQTPVGRLEIDTTLTGRFNGYNVMAALAGGLALGLPPAAMGRGIAALRAVPGRFERVLAGQPFEVIVDYAHTPDSLQTVLQTARELTQQRLICVFGCGGDRDSGKRPLMGRVAETLADRVFLTSDNPRNEDPEAIIAQIVAGMEAPEKRQIIADRYQAIAAALSQVLPGEVVVIAGKGHEAVQLIADRRIAFDDRAVARQILQPLFPGVEAAR